MISDNFTRREFFRFCARLAVLFGGGSVMADDFAQAFMKVAQRTPPVIWLTGQACTGDSMSLVYGDSPTLVPLLSSLVDLKFHPVLSVAQGDMVFDLLEEQFNKGGYVLCFEGSIPMKMPEACLFGERAMADFLVEVLERAGAVIACGTCACYGGIPKANPETGAVSIVDFARSKGLNVPVVRIPGCPMNAHRFTGTVAYFVAYGRLPRLDEEGRPVTYYGQTVHENCLRFQSFAQDKYVVDYNQKNLCLFRMGCRGPVTHADCPVRRWNRETSWCVSSNTPCVGCAHPQWPWSRETGIYVAPGDVPPEIDFGGLKKKG